MNILLHHVFVDEKTKFLHRKNKSLILESKKNGNENDFYFKCLKLVNDFKEQCPNFSKNYYHVFLPTPYDQDVQVQSIVIQDYEKDVVINISLSNHFNINSKNYIEISKSINYIDVSDKIEFYITKTAEQYSFFNKLDSAMDYNHMQLKNELI